MPSDEIPNSGADKKRENSDNLPSFSKPKRGKLPFTGYDDSPKAEIVFDRGVLTAKHPAAAKITYIDSDYSVDDVLAFVGSRKDKILAFQWLRISDYGEKKEKYAGYGVHQNAEIVFETVEDRDKFVESSAYWEHPKVTETIICFGDYRKVDDNNNVDNDVLNQLEVPFPEPMSPEPNLPQATPMSTMPSPGPTRPIFPEYYPENAVIQKRMLTKNNTCAPFYPDPNAKTNAKTSNRNVEIQQLEYQFKNKPLQWPLPESFNHEFFWRIVFKNKREIQTICSEIDKIITLYEQGCTAMTYLKNLDAHHSRINKSKVCYSRLLLYKSQPTRYKPLNKCSASVKFLMIEVEMAGNTDNDLESAAEMVANVFNKKYPTAVDKYNAMAGKMELEPYEWIDPEIDPNNNYVKN